MNQSLFWENFDKILARNFVNIALTSVSHFLWQPVQPGRACTWVWTNQRPGSPPLDQSEAGPDCQPSVMRNNMKSPLQQPGPPSFRLSQPGKYFVYCANRNKVSSINVPRWSNTRKCVHNFKTSWTFELFTWVKYPALPYLAISLSGPAIATGDAILLVLITGSQIFLF